MLIKILIGGVMSIIKYKIFLLVLVIGGSAAAIFGGKLLFKNESFIQVYTPKNAGTFDVECDQNHNTCYQY